MITLPGPDARALTAFLQALVRTPSFSTQEGAVAACLAREMRQVGMADVWTDRIGNVIGRVGAGRGPRLLFNAHMDTVQVTDRADWRHDPFGGEVENGLLYGRGAADMKGALAAMVYGAKLLLDVGSSLRGDLYVVGVVQEEPAEGLGMRVLVEEEGLRPDWVVLGEPSGLQVKRGHRGRTELRVSVPGKACHASAPELGENAIYRAARLITQLEELAGELAAAPPSAAHPWARGRLAVTQVESQAGSRNAVPDHCTFFIDRRLALGEDEALVLAEVRQFARRMGIPVVVEVTTYEATAYTGYRAGQRVFHPAWELGEAHLLVRAVVKAAGTVLGREPQVGLWNFSTDGVYTMGEAGIPTVGFGPGEERCAHAADEHVCLADVAAAAQVYARLALDLLG